MYFFCIFWGFFHCLKYSFTLTRCLFCTFFVCFGIFSLLDVLYHFHKCLCRARHFLKNVVQCLSRSALKFGLSIQGSESVKFIRNENAHNPSQNDENNENAHNPSQNDENNEDDEDYIHHHEDDENPYHNINYNYHHHHIIMIILLS